MTVDTAPPGHRERKKLATRHAIHQAAFDLVEQLGLAHTTVEAISERAGVAPRTFWSYFASKEDAVLDRDPATPARLGEALRSRPPTEEPLTALRRVLDDFMAERVVDSEMALRRQHLIRREPQLMASVAASFEEIERALVSAVLDRIGAGRDRQMLARVLVMASCGVCRVAQQHWADGNGARSYPRLVDEAYHQLLCGLGPLVESRAAAGKGRA
jgi:AcrR family transcriptional regulator